MKYSTNLDNYEEGVFKKKSPSSLFRLPLLDNFRCLITRGQVNFNCDSVSRYTFICI